jgi:hypothetical protein
MTSELLVLFAVWVMAFGSWYEVRSLRKWMEKQTEEK